MSIQFQKATKTQGKLRLALTGPSGSGKTYSALAIASGLGSRVAVLDTERGSASKYAGVSCEFDKVEIDNFHPQTFIDVIKAAESAGYDVLIIDSLSHAWNGKGGALEQVDSAAKRSKSGNAYTAWRDVTPLQNSLVDAMLQSKMHIIATMRSKTEYVLETGSNGRQMPRKVGMAPIQRDGMEYEFDVIGELDADHNLIVTKSRCPALSDAVIAKPGKQLSSQLMAWLSDGAPLPKVAPVIDVKPLPEIKAAAIETPKVSPVDAEFTANEHPEPGSDVEFDRPLLEQIAACETHEELQGLRKARNSKAWSKDERAAWGRRDAELRVK